MRRLIITFLLCLLPVQFAFAAAAGYCGLEKTRVASHFGHHDHPGSVAAPEPEKDGGTGSLEVECGVCHLGCAQPHASMPGVAALPVAIVVAALRDSPAPDHLQEPTERPPRTSLA